jgi:methylmalonyl-CoA mutase cobalamin-binding subunit
MVASRPDQSPSKSEAESTSWVVDPVKGSMTDVVVVSIVDRRGSVTVERVVSAEDATGSVTVEAACVGVVVAEDDVDGVEEEVVDNVVVTG